MKIKVFYSKLLAQGGVCHPSGAIDARDVYPEPGPCQLIGRRLEAMLQISGGIKNNCEKCNGPLSPARLEKLISSSLEASRCGT